ncbi:dynein heavy chain [Entomophthora muscae]|uniref:Dynein heavy chain n=1 Tax=Entomophthora muscae TaxID=34485 RepID=A0ACC2SYT7_9FUNG|nr:dynein heavy chain [Entomophthora muscae]
MSPPKLSKRQGRHNHVTPRHYLDFINHYVQLHSRSVKILKSNSAISTLAWISAARYGALKEKELNEKNREANEKLKEMVADQQEAESKKEDSIKIQSELEIKNKAIAERTSIVMADLANAEPAKSVRNIKKNHLTEVRSMANPPLYPLRHCHGIRLHLLGHKIEGWKTVQGILRRDDFISSIETYRTEEKLTRAIRERIKKEYMTKSEYNFETVNRASKACGPLVQWAIAQEVVDLSNPAPKSAQETQSKPSIEKMIQDLEASIATYKEEHAILISQVQATKGEMERSAAVSLFSAACPPEKERWESSSQALETQMGTIVGTACCQLPILHMAQYREQLFSKWASHLVRSNIQFKHDISLTEYLSTADERLAWQANALPADDLCIENAIMLKPLIDTSHH